MAPYCDCRGVSDRSIGANVSCGSHGHEDWVEDGAHEELADGPNDAVEVVAVDVQHDVYAVSCQQTYITSSINK